MTPANWYDKGPGRFERRDGASVVREARERNGRRHWLGYRPSGEPLSNPAFPKPAPKRFWYAREAMLAVNQAFPEIEEAAP